MAAAGSSAGIGASADTGTAGYTGSAGASVAAAGSGSFALQAPNAMMLGMDEYAFPATALPPMNYSPELSWSGVPAGAKSLALTFTDVTSSAYKWVVWDIAPSVTHVPAHVSNMAMPMEVPGASQLGSLGNQGYAGPCCEDHGYAFELWALDLEKLPDTARRSTADLYKTVLPMHEIVKSEPVQLRIAP
jgi:Raf kinase inhibitor-like YbhB/YbcL family protein